MSTKGRHTRTIGRTRHIWLVEDLWHAASTLPIREVDPATVIDLDRDGWFGSATPTPRLVLAHMARILEADLSYPIILDVDGTILDGAHRVCKALLERRPNIRVVQFATTPPPSFVEVLERC